MTAAIGPYSVEERVIDGHTTWVALRARGAEWSWLTPAEAARLGQLWVKRYGHFLRDDKMPEHAEAVVLIAAE
jgi:hypothetical protein